MRHHQWITMSNDFWQKIRYMHKDDDNLRGSNSDGGVDSKTKLTTTAYMCRINTYCSCAFTCQNFVVRNAIVELQWLPCHRSTVSLENSPVKLLRIDSPKFTAVWSGPTFVRSQGSPYGLRAHYDHLVQQYQLQIIRVRVRIGTTISAADNCVGYG